MWKKLSYLITIELNIYSTKLIFRIYTRIYILFDKVLFIWTNVNKLLAQDSYYNFSKYSYHHFLLYIFMLPIFSENCWLHCQLLKWKCNIHSDQISCACLRTGQSVAMVPSPWPLFTLVPSAQAALIVFVVSVVIRFFKSVLFLFQKFFNALENEIPLVLEKRFIVVLTNSQKSTVFLVNTY